MFCRPFRRAAFPIAAMQKFVSFFVWLHLFNNVSSRSSSYSNSMKRLDENLARGHITLNDMFREVETLMEDTQHKLEEAVYQMHNETVKSLSFAHDVIPSTSPKSVDLLGEEELQIVEQIRKGIDNKTGEIHVIQATGRWNEVDHECLINEDCATGKYCLYQILTSKCVPCKAPSATCGKDEECCAGHLCVWGKCSSSGVTGQSGTICQFQSDCSPQHCCAFHKELLFPVCTPRPQELQPCQGHPNLLMDLLQWDVEGPREYCPCAAGLECQPRRRGSLCLDVGGSSGEESPRPDFL